MPREEERNPWAEPERPWHSCRRCGHRWQQKFARKPKQCPECHQGGYDRAPTKAADALRESRANGKFTCVRCGHRWNPKAGFPADHRPGTCPSCGTRRWDRPPTGHPGYYRRWLEKQKARTHRPQGKHPT